MGRSLQPALAALKAWAREWLDPDESASAPGRGPDLDLRRPVGAHGVGPPGHPLG